MEKRHGHPWTAAAGFCAFVLLLLGICCFGASAAGLFTRKVPASVTTAAAAKLPVIVIDAGHGGMDGGAVGAGGTPEKEINLAVAEKLAELCRLSGVDFVMTRTADVMLVEDSVKSHRKMHDLKNRLATVRAVTDTGREAIFVSIHMNNFTDPHYSGLQVWHADDDVSRKLAASVQTYARTFLDPENGREIKKATSAIYVLAHAEVPSILVECGFLSNPAECARLGEDSYRTSLAVTIFAAIMEEITKNA